MEIQTHSQSDLRLISYTPTTRRASSASTELATPIPTVSEVWQTVSPAPAVVEPRPRIELASRVLNVAIAGTALVALSPLMLITAVLVKATSRGPVFYRQTRVGVDRRRPKGDLSFYDRRTRDLGGRVFAIYKFRSMTADAERASGAVWATKSDPRVTPLGRILRKSRIDELPQLFNVIRGDMNIVGPRPERPSIFANLRKDIADYPLRQLAMPGITGWAQINHSYDTSIEDVKTKVRFDLEYLQRQSVVEDLKIMLCTVPVMLFRRGGW
jgi:lipopolysaccharide/colanic/teichoic acid biosynthesis glycosyltransferase